MSSEMERLRDELDRHDRRLTVVEAETERTRARMHRLENDRATTRALAKTTQQLAEQTRILSAKASTSVDHAEKLVESAAERAVEKVYGRRIEQRWRLAVRGAAVLTAIGGFGAFIAYLFMH